MELVCLSYTSPKPSTGRQTGIRSNAPKGPKYRSRGNSMPGTWLGEWVMERKKQASLGQIKMLTETHKQILPSEQQHSCYHHDKS